MVRVLVLRDLPREEHNAPLHLFSAAREQIEYGQKHFRRRSRDTSSLVLELLEGYDLEEGPMSYTMEDFRRDFKQKALKFLKELPPEERLEGLPPEERLKGLPPEERLKGLSREDIENYLKKLNGG